MYYELDQTCARCDFCKEAIGFQVAIEMFLNTAGRTSGSIRRCEDCNLYIERTNTSN